MLVIRQPQHARHGFRRGEYRLQPIRAVTGGKMGVRVEHGFRAGRQYGVPMPTTSAARDQVQTLIGHGYDQDFSQLLLLQAKASGIELKSENVDVGDGLS